MLTFWVYGTKFTQKISIEPLKKVQNMILQQSSKIQGGYIDSKAISTLIYYMHVLVILLCSLLTHLLLVHNVDFTFLSSDLVHNFHLLALIF